MAEHAPKTRTIPVELPLDGLAGRPLDPREVADDLRLLWLVEQVRRGVISTGKGADLAGIPKARFLRTLGQHGVPVVHVDPEDYDSEFGPPATPR